MSHQPRDQVPLAHHGAISGRALCKLGREPILMTREVSECLRHVVNLPIFYHKRHDTTAREVALDLLLSNKLVPLFFCKIDDIVLQNII